MPKRIPRIEQTQGLTLPKYNLMWAPLSPPLWIELQMISLGGRYKKKKDGTWAGEGNIFHFKKAIEIAWPEISQHRWFDFFLENWLKHKFIGVLGPKSSGKTFCAAVFHLVDYWAFPHSTTVIVCSTTIERLEDRIWGEIKKWHRIAKSRFNWLPGNLIEGRTRLVTDARDEASEGRDFRCGMLGVPLLKGGTASMGSFVGIKNKRVRLCGDELQLCPKVFLDATANLSGNSELKVTGMGNPSDVTDTLSMLCEPHTSVGGWDGGIDQSPKTKSWKTRFEEGICVHLPGSDCPNMDVGPDEPVPFPFLITRKQMQEDAKTWGKDDWHYLMFDEGILPRGQGSRRVITRQLCLKHKAMDSPVWKSTQRTKIVALDAAYRSVGGDRCCLIDIEFGEEGVTQDLGTEVAENLVNQTPLPQHKQIILAMTGLTIIPIKPSDFESPEDQITMFVKQHCEQRGVPPKNFFFDSGMRTSLVSSFTRLWSVDVNPLDCGGRPSERNVSENIDVKCCDYYSKRITEFWYSVRLIIEGGQFRGMTEDVMQEGCAREWKTVGANKIEVETKADMKEKTGRSPDLFDALAVGIEGARQRGFQIRRLANKEYQDTDTRWKGELRRKVMESVKSKQLIYSA